MRITRTEIKNEKSKIGYLEVEFHNQDGAVIESYRFCLEGYEPPSYLIKTK